MDTNFKNELRAKLKCIVFVQYSFITCKFEISDTDTTRRTEMLFPVERIEPYRNWKCFN